MEALSRTSSIRQSTTARAVSLLLPGGVVERDRLVSLRDRPSFGRGPQARVLERQAIALESRCPGTYGHSHRVAALAAELGRRLRFSRRQLRLVRRAAILHDIGKVRTPSEIVNKPGPLTPDEYTVVCRHPEDGAALVAELGDEALTAAVRHHHERWDGAGYPDALEGDQIPIASRIVAIADTFDALTSSRPYRPAKGHSEALEVILDEAGAQLDPELATLFYESYADLWA